MWPSVVGLRLVLRCIWTSHQLPISFAVTSCSAVTSCHIVTSCHVLDTYTSLFLFFLTSECRPDTRDSYFVAKITLGKMAEQPAQITIEFSEYVGLSTLRNIMDFVADGCSFFNHLKFADIVVTFGETSVAAHRYLLACRSEWFNKLCSSNFKVSGLPLLNRIRADRL